MQYLYQFTIILVVTFFGEALHALIPLNIPASVYGLVIMLLCLSFKIIPVEKVEAAGRYLIDIMPIMFIPPAVGLMSVWGDVRPIAIPIFIISIVSTVVVVAATGLVAQGVIKLGRRRGNG